MTRDVIFITFSKENKKILTIYFETTHKISKQILTTAGLRQIPHLSIVDDHNTIKLIKIT